jgi:hypothetical protein
LLWERKVECAEERDEVAPGVPAVVVVPALFDPLVAVPVPRMGEQTSKLNELGKGGGELDSTTGQYPHSYKPSI